jgi:hypothetical protein
MPKVRTVRSISAFVDGFTTCVVEPTIPLTGAGNGTDIAALLYIDGPSSLTQHIFGNAGSGNKGWALQRLTDSGLNAQFNFAAFQAGGVHNALLTVPLSNLVGRCVLLQASIIAANISIGIGNFATVTTALGAAYVPGAGVTSIGIDVNGGNVSPVLEGTRIAAVAYCSDHTADSDGIRANTPLAGDLGPVTNIANWTIYSFTQGLAGVVGPTNVQVPDGTVVDSIGGTAGTATFATRTGHPTVQLSPFPG